MLKVFITSMMLLLSLSTMSTQEQNPSNNSKTDMVILSFDRPLQLYALLQSVDKYVTNLNKIFILYRVSDDAYNSAYEELKIQFNKINFVKQGPNPRQDFKPLLGQLFLATDAEYIVFSVDDDIIRDYIDFKECVHALQKYDGYGFYLRVGLNITHNWPSNQTVTIPPYQEVEKDIIKYQFKNGTDAWGYPHNVDMTVFKKSDIKDYYLNGNYNSPNTLEGNWGGADYNKYGLCYKTAKKFMLPLNLVQQDWYNPNQNSYSAAQLLQMWNQGLCIDINQFADMQINSFAIGTRPTFINRKIIAKS